MSKCKYPECEREATRGGFCQSHQNYTLTRRYQILRRDAKPALGISRAEYIRLVEGGKCSYCESDVGVTSGHSLDKLDPLGGYTVSNVVLCCRNCNLIKNNLLTGHEMRAIVKVLKRLRKSTKQCPLWAKQGGKRHGI